MGNYIIKLTVKTPVHIGNGNTISKKDFTLTNNKTKVTVYDPIELFDKFGVKYEQFLTDTKRTKETLTDFLNNNKEKSITEKYFLEVMSDIRKSDNIAEFIKDSWGNPYIPGSSLKGAIRTLMLQHFVSKNKTGKYTEFQKSYIKKGDKTTAKEIEKLAFGETLKDGETLDDKFRHIKISDSKPLEVSDLIICDKFDVSTKGNDRPLNLCRECIKPGTVIEFMLHIDEKDGKEIPWKMEELYGTIVTATYDYQKMMHSHFEDYAHEPRQKNMIYLGGGVGYIDKTIAYQLYGPEEGTKKIGEYLEKSFRNGNHDKDWEIGIAPHMLKCTQYDKKLVEMGLCTITIAPVEEE